MSYYYVNLTKQYFQFLINEFGFSIIKESYNPEIKIGNGSVMYQSKFVTLEVVVDKTEVLLKIGQRRAPLEKRFDFLDVMKCFAPEVEDAYLRSGITLTLKDSLVIETRIRNIGTLLRKYCQPLLAGDFSMKANIKEVEEKRARRIWGDVQPVSQNYQRG
jgi:hypothetical protein